MCATRSVKEPGPYRTRLYNASPRLATTPELPVGHRRSDLALPTSHRAFGDVTDWFGSTSMPPSDVISTLQPATERLERTNISAATGQTRISVG